MSKKNHNVELEINVHSWRHNATLNHQIFVVEYDNEENEVDDKNGKCTYFPVSNILEIMSCNILETFMCCQ